MSLWQIEYIDDRVEGKYKVVSADMVRVSTQSGDMWFCDEADKKYTNDYLPKFILAKGSYLSIERIAPKEPTPMSQPVAKVYNKAQVEKAKQMDWI